MFQRTFRALLFILTCVCGLNFAQAQSVFFDTESTFLRLHTSNANPLVNNATGYDQGQRFQLGLLNADDLGVRVTYWDWDHQGTNANGVVVSTLDTYNLDAEVLKRVDLFEMTNFEFSAGVRYNDLTATNPVFGTTNSTSGIGGLLGIRGAVDVGCNGELYARSKWAVIMGNGTTFGALPNPGFDVLRNQWEIGMGYQHNFCFENGMLMWARVGAEWITFTGSEPGIGLPGSYNDLGLGGLVLGLGISR